VYDRNSIAQDKNPPWPPTSPWPQTPAPNTPGGPPSSPPPVFTYQWDSSGNPQANYPGTLNAIGAGGGGAVTSVQGRTGAVSLIPADLPAMNGAPLTSPAFNGVPTAPTAGPGTVSGQLATCAFVAGATSALNVVQSFNTRMGNVVLSLADLINAGGAPLNAPSFTGNATAVTPPGGDASQSIATTAFVSTALASGVLSWNGRKGAVILNLSDVLSVGGAPLVSPGFTGVPTCPTASPHTGTTQIASTAYVDNAIVASTGGVSSFNTRSGAVTLTTADVTSAGGAPIVSPAMTGTPTAPTQGAADNSTKLATTAFVATALASGAVQSFNGRSGVVTLSNADIIGAGGAPLASPAFTGTPSLPTGATGVTQAPGDNDASIATTAFVTGGIATAIAPLAPTTALANYLPLAGGTLTGPLAVTPASGAAFLTLNKSASGFGAYVMGQMAGSSRWQVSLGSNAPEGGSNSGSDFNVSRYSDAGAAIDTPLSINRANGQATFANPVNIAPASGSATLFLNKAGSGAVCAINAWNSGTIRWQMLLGNTVAETGSGNAGSDFALTRFSDAGVALDTPLSISRATGAVAIADNASVSGGNFTLTNAAGTALIADAAAGAVRQIMGRTSGSLRWTIQLCTGVAEGGSNSGSDFAISRFNDTGAGIDVPISIKRSTGVTTFSAAIVNGPSDRTLKENIRPIDPAEALGDVLELRPVRFNMIADEAKRAQIGLIAQDVATVVPEVLQEYRPDADAPPKLALDYPKLVATLIGAVQALTARVAALEGAGKPA
jgi:hypothetical protein